MIGQTISHYKILEKIGEGGMGVVYQATDTRLGREVALKILPEKFVEDRQRMSRFQREAEILASLNHPNISTIYGLEEADGVRALVLELVEGPTLAERIADGPIPVEETLRIALEITQALEVAHEKGIIHRDLKPANVKITPEGTVKVLDFGLAKALETEVLERELANSPTLTHEATQEGILLGTAAYMSPEQARGRSVDRRTDIWSFGLVLLEMLIGKRIYAGKSFTETIAAVIHQDLSLEGLPKDTPWRIRELLERCLRKDPRMRLQHMGDARIELSQELSDPDSGLPVETTKRRIATLPMVGIAVAIALVVASVTWLAKPAREAVPLPVVHAEIVLAEGDRLAHFLAISPDGQTLAFHAGPEPDGEPAMVKTREIMLRRLDQPREMPIAGTQGWGRYPTFSPDGASIAYATRDGLYRVPATGGQPTKLCENRFTEDGRLRPPFGLTWGEDDTIIIGDGTFIIGRHNGLQRVAASGGPVETITEVDSDARELSHRLPHFLPGSRAVLFTVHRYEHFLAAPGAWSVWALRLETGERTLVVEHASDARYANGQIVFVREGSLLTAPFDPDRLEMTGDPRIVLEGVQHWVYTQNTGTETGGGQFALSPTGTLAYVPGSVYPEQKTTVVSVDREGNETAIGVEPRSYGSLRGSPDGRQLLLSVNYAPTSAVWIHDMERGVSRRQRADGYGLYAAWGPGPGWITYDRTSDDGERRLLSKPIGGSLADETEIAYPEGPIIWMGEWSPDGKHLAGLGGGGMDLWTYTVGEGWTPLTETDNVREGWPAFSPDGRWLAYGSNESGASMEVYVRPFPGAGPTVQVSRSGGIAPVWSRDGTELFFRSVAESQRWIMAAPVSSIDGRLDIGRPVRLFEDIYIFTTPVRRWDILADGKFAFSKRRDAEQRREELRALQPDRIRIVQNWASQLKR